MARRLRCACRPGEAPRGYVFRGWLWLAVEPVLALGVGVTGFGGSVGLGGVDGLGVDAPAESVRSK